MADRTIQKLARKLELSEITIRAMVHRGYSLQKLERMFAPEGSPQALAGEAAENAVRRRVRFSRNLPCGEPVRMFSSSRPGAREEYEHACWLDFQFKTGTHGDRMVSGAIYPADPDGVL
jgi:hypothetical protein